MIASFPTLEHRSLWQIALGCYLQRHVILPCNESFWRQTLGCGVTQQSSKSSWATILLILRLHRGSYGIHEKNSTLPNAGIYMYCLKGVMCNSGATRASASWKGDLIAWFTVLAKVVVWDPLHVLVSVFDVENYREPRKSFLPKTLLPPLIHILVH